MLKIKVEKTIEIEGKDGQRIQVHAGSYEQTIRRSDRSEMEILRKIVADVNDLQIKNV